MNFLLVIYAYLNLNPVNISLFFNTLKKCLSTSSLPGMWGKTGQLVEGYRYSCGIYGAGTIYALYYHSIYCKYYQ